MFGETDNDQLSSADEPYVILSISTPERAATFMTRTYDGIDGGESCPDLIELYRGKPYGINLQAVVMESDFGDPGVYRKEVEEAVNGAHKLGTMALGAIPVAGPIIASVAGPLIGSFIPKIAGAISDWLNFEDDRIGSATVTLSAKQMVVLATRTNNTNF